MGLLYWKFRRTKCNNLNVLFYEKANNTIGNKPVATFTGLFPFIPFCAKGEIFMRKYTLASPDSRAAVDLRDFQSIIEDAVHEYQPNAVVRVEADCYFVDPAPPQGAAIKIGRKICQSNLKRHCIQIPKLFSSININMEEKENGEEKQKCSGGHR